MVNRVILIVMDSLGVGALDDAREFGDRGANTFGHIVKQMDSLRIPHLQKLGMTNIEGVLEEPWHIDHPIGAFGKACERSNGKDTITGHWEIAGIETKMPFKTYPDGFPKEIIQKLEKEIGRKVLGNYPASGTEIIETLGEEHEKTGKPIVYTSADSVFQIAANVDVIEIEELYKICETARRLLVGEFACGRVIARPYTMVKGKRVRTAQRKDYSVDPPQRTLLDKIKDSHKTVYCVGKIGDIFSGHGVSVSVHTENNDDGVEKTVEAIAEDFSGLIFTNLVDFDAVYGHRRDVIGYGHAIEAFDRGLGKIMETMKEDDVLILCADHGNDPTHQGWDHTREHIPVLVYGKKIKENISLGTLDSFADIGQTIAQMLDVEKLSLGHSFYDKVKK